MAKFRKKWKNMQAVVVLCLVIYKVQAAMNSIGPVSLVKSIDLPPEYQIKFFYMREKSIDILTMSNTFVRMSYNLEVMMKYQFSIEQEKFVLNSEHIHVYTSTANPLTKIEELYEIKKKVVKIYQKEIEIALSFRIIEDFMVRFTIRNRIVFLDFPSLASIDIFRVDPINQIASFAVRSLAEVTVFYTTGQLLVINTTGGEIYKNYTYQITNISVEDHYYSSDFNYILTVEKYLNFTYFKKYRIDTGYKQVGEVLIVSNNQISFYRFHEDDQNIVVKFSNFTYRICNFECSCCFKWNGVNIKNEKEVFSGREPRNLSCGFINRTHFTTLTDRLRVNIFTFGKLNTLAQQQKAKEEWPFGPVGDPNATKQPDQTTGNSSGHFFVSPQKQKQNSSFSRSSKTLAAALSFPNAKQIFKVFNPIYIFVEDFWFYSYHNRQYSKNVNRVFEIIREINQAKIMPVIFYKFTDYLKKHVNLENATQSNFTALSPEKFVKIQKSEVNFFKNTEEIIVWNYFYSILTFLVIKIAAKTPIRKAKYIGNFFRQNSHNGIIVLTLIESNAQYLAFMSFAQLNVVGQLDIFDIIKLMATLLFLFFITFFSIGGYLTMKGFFSKKTCQVFLNHSKNKSSSFGFASLTITVRSLLMGFSHGFLINWPHYQAPLIICLDIVSIGSLIWFWNCSCTWVGNSLLILYYFFRLVFDILILNEITIKHRAQYLQVYIIGAMILVIIFLFFWNVFAILKELLMKFTWNSDNEDMFDAPEVPKGKGLPKTKEELSENNENNQQPIQSQKKQSIFHPLAYLFIDSSIAADPSIAPNSDSAKTKKNLFLQHSKHRHSRQLKQPEQLSSEIEQEYKKVTIKIKSVKKKAPQK